MKVKDAFLTAFLTVMAIVVVVGVMFFNENSKPPRDRWLNAHTFNCELDYISHLTDGKQKWYIFSLEGKQFGFMEDMPFVAYRAEIFVKEYGYDVRFYGEPVTVYDGQSLMRVLKSEDRNTLKESEIVYRQMVDIAVNGGRRKTQV